jgi:probable DNA metabolism protein
MSEFPIDAEIIRFGLKVLSAGTILRRASANRETQEKARFEAERIARNRGDRDVRTVWEAAFKVRHEIDRLRGLLRFSLGENGFYVARCAPDHFVLPALGPHFCSRFGEEPWAAADEKRSLILIRERGGEARLFPLEDSFKIFDAGTPQDDPWEALWKNYHQSINNESRNNLPLQRRFMPERYWKYLPEMSRRSR